MATETPSRATLADVLAAIEATQPIGARRNDMASAVRAVARALDRPAAEIEADPRRLAIRLKSVSAVTLGITERRWNNIRSLFRQALSLVTSVMPGRSEVPLSPDWARLMEHLSGNRADRIRVIRLVRWLSGQRLAPAVVQAADLERFQAALTGEALLANPDATWRDAVQAWNRCVKTVPGWPQLRIERQSKREVYTLPWSAFPESLKADVDGWLRRLTCDDLDDEGPVTAVKPSTQMTREYQLRSFASALVHQGVNPATLSALRDCLTLENYKLGLRFYLDRRGDNKKSTTVHSLAAMLKAVARHWVKVDQALLDAMTKIVRKLAVPGQGMTQKNRDRLRPLLDKPTAERLLRLPQLLMDDLDRNKVSKSRRKVVVQMAVAIEILLMAPIRIRNLSELHIDRNLVRVGKHYHLVIDGSDVKNGQDLEFELPEESCKLIDLYLSDHRKAEPGNRYLFPGDGEGPKHISALRQQIQRVVKDYMGLDINPHLFRHIAAAIYLDANPNGYEVVRRLLGHRSLDTTMEFYVALQGLSAGRHFAKTITSLRQRSTLGQLQ